MGLKVKDANVVCSWQNTAYGGELPFGPGGRRGCEIDSEIKRTVVPRRRPYVFRATNDDENATHVLVQKMDINKRVSDRQTRPERSLFYESKSNNDRRAESINIMTWGKRLFCLRLGRRGPEEHLGKMRAKSVTGGY